MEQSIDTQSQFWQAILAQPFQGYHFDRHVLIDPLIVDFACIKNRVIVEVDETATSTHNQSCHHRTQYLKNQGFEVIRLSVDELTQDVNQVLAHIQQRLNTC